MIKVLTIYFSYYGLEERIDLLLHHHKILEKFKFELGRFLGRNFNVHFALALKRFRPAVGALRDLYTNNIHHMNASLPKFLPRIEKVEFLR